MGHSIILTAANPARNVVQWTRVLYPAREREVCTSIGKKGRKREQRRRKREKGKEENENKNREKARLSGVEKLGAYNGIRGVARVYLKGGEKTVSGLRMIEIDGSTIDPGQQIFSPVQTTRGNATDVVNGADANRKHGTKTSIGPRDRAVNEFNGWNLIW